MIKKITGIVIKIEEGVHTVVLNDNTIVKLRLGEKQKNFDKFKDGLLMTIPYDIEYEDQNGVNYTTWVVPAGKEVKKKVDLEDIDKKLDKIFEAVLELKEK